MHIWGWNLLNGINEISISLCKHSSDSKSPNDPVIFSVALLLTWNRNHFAQVQSQRSSIFRSRWNWEKLIDTKFKSVHSRKYSATMNNKCFDSSVSLSPTKWCQGFDSAKQCQIYWPSSHNLICAVLNLIYKMECMYNLDTHCMTNKPPALLFMQYFS